ncbi:hypothetical protein [Pseudomonas trivialis]|uniref:hypothetical protein n=1 Tax=Pseudomonas trivialis TaxID=200450 RepID=UPI0030D2A7E3
MTVVTKPRALWRRCIALWVLIPAIALAAPALASAKPLRIGITLHPYYSFVANIVGDRAQVVALIPAEAQPAQLPAAAR